MFEFDTAVGGRTGQQLCLNIAPEKFRADLTCDLFDVAFAGMYGAGVTGNVITDKNGFGCVMLLWTEAAWVVPCSVK